ncbi:DUF2769 domain-containing protein [Dehalogenimonas etheniformans]|uniref:DUF2769 domain-containing protein n=1 Tax=Dehalogenimonas etheniformans TaxID=1536648 RepID=A0A2P5P8F0_9CHLR|nr:DUF2769 domain-containing protein [Dehalogenimonas etheniformans]PPD58555.1 DUF2769 domain-containing protein [Dehalogenimonas etheniformans]QNT76681.1 DUF2769 domain-containing protein [Dehalogenimonas etheniformans]
MKAEDSVSSAQLNQNEAIKDCLCRMCPSYIECEEPVGFCVSPKPSKCIDAEAGCLCLGCPWWVRNSLRHVYFCTRGAEATQ